MAESLYAEQELERTDKLHVPDSETFYLAALLAVGPPPMFMNTPETRRYYTKLREWHAQSVANDYTYWLHFYNNYKQWFYTEGIHRADGRAGS